MTGKQMRIASKIDAAMQALARTGKNDLTHMPSVGQKPPLNEGTQCVSTSIKVQMPDVIPPPRPPPPVLPPEDPERDDPNEPDHRPPLIPPPPVLNRSWNRKARPAVRSGRFAQLRNHRAILFCTLRPLTQASARLVMCFSDW